MGSKMLELKECRAIGKPKTKTVNMIFTVALGVAIPVFTNFVISPTLEDRESTCSNEKKQAVKKALQSYTTIVTISSFISVALLFATEVTITYSWGPAETTDIARNLSRLYAVSAACKALVLLGVTASTISVVATQKMC